VPVDRCQCAGELKNLTTHDRYEEDIPPPELNPGYQPHLVTKYVIARGICGSCGKTTSGQDLGGAKVFLGSNARLLVTHLVAGAGMSYNGVAKLLRNLYGITVSDGEIANILQRQHQVWLPAYNQLGADIRVSPVAHVDETSWPIQSLQGVGYAWDICDASSEKVYFVPANSRGAPHAKALFGQDTDQPFVGVRISDDYGAYRSADLPGSQQLCWAHLHRCIRDLRYNANLPEEQLPYVTWWYEQFATIYQDLRMYLDEPYDEVVRATQAQELWQRLQPLLPAKTSEPEKLTRLKAQLTRAGKDRLFTCLPKDTPCDNNRAERDLRQLVLKRKQSFGSKTQQGANASATVLSICTTTRRSNPNNYFSTLAALA
jgi:transposase